MPTQETHDEFRANVRRLAEEKIKPHAAEVDEEAAFPTASIAAFKAMGLNGLPFPEKLGGGNGDLLSQVIAVEEIARVCGSSALVLFIPWAALTPLVWFGDDALKKKDRTLHRRRSGGSQLLSHRTRRRLGSAGA